MEIWNLNKCMCEELFGGELDVTEEQQGWKFHVRLHRNWLNQHHAEDLNVLQKVLGVLLEMGNFCRTKKNMFLHIRNGIGESLHELEVLKRSLARRDKRWSLRKRRSSWTTAAKLPQPALRPTPEYRKRLREPTFSLEVIAAMKSKEKKPRTSKKEEEWLGIPSRKNLQKKKTKKYAKRTERPRRARSEAVLYCPPPHPPDWCWDWAADCRWPDRSKSCWKCSEEVQTAVSCTRKP